MHPHGVLIQNNKVNSTEGRRPRGGQHALLNISHYYFSSVLDLGGIRINRLICEGVSRLNPGGAHCRVTDEKIISQEQ